MPQSPGKKIKIIRESRGISLEEIANKTHIRLDYLEAIESDELDKLPSAVHTRGFLRLYANELGINLEELSVKGTQEEKKTAPDSEVENRPNEEQIDDRASKKPPSNLNSKKKTEPESKTKDVFEKNKNQRADLTEISVPSRSEHASAIFNAIGAKLQVRRKLLSLSFDDIAENLHIQNKFLIALESGDFELLPSPVQARGMLANYAEFLNLDVDEILLQFADALQVQRIENQKQNESTKQRSSRELSPTKLRLKNFFSIDLLVIAGLILGFAAFIIWGVNRIMSTDNLNQEATDIPEVVDVLLATGSPTPEISTTSDETQMTDEVLETTPGEATPIFTSMPNNNPINIVIVPRQSAWVQIKVDEELLFEGRLLTGNAYDYSGEETIEILTGNAGALQIFFNDQDIGSPGLNGQILNMIFTETGLVQPTPTNTPTITNTPRATPSPTPTPTATQTRMPTATSMETNDETN